MTHSRRIGFDGWILHVDLGELEREGQRTRLQDQPFQVLHELLSRPGELVTREQLIARLWPKGVVDYDLGLNSAVRKLRIALQDEADTPRYIQTLPRKGYRFIGTLDASDTQTDTSDTHSDPDDSKNRVRQSGEPEQPANRPRLHWLGFELAAAILIVGAGIGFATWPNRDVARVATVSPESVSQAAVSAPTLAVTAQAGSPLAAAIVAALRDRFADIEGLAVLSSSSARTLVEGKVQAASPRYLLRTRVQSTDPLRVHAEFFDSTNDGTLWSQTFEATADDIGPVAEEAARQTANALQLKYEPHATADVNLTAYELYVRAEQLVAETDPEEAALLLTRVTELDPQFARAYALLGQALMLGEDLKGKGRSSDVVTRAQRAFDRALALNPRLGEVFVHRARLTADRAQIEHLYRRGIELAPGYDTGYANYAKFLTEQRRRGEAIELIARARRIDPYSIVLFQADAVAHILSRSDLAAHDAVLQEALSIQPENVGTLMQMAQARYLWAGEFAESIRLAETARVHQPQFDQIRQFAASVYLDLDDVAAAASLLPSASAIGASVEVAQYRRDARSAAALAADLPIAPFHAVSPVAEAVRDGAMLSGDYIRALERLKAAYQGWVAAPITNRSVAAVYAHTLVLAGRTQEGFDLARSLLKQVEAEGAARPDYWFARDRATLYAILGEDERALVELEAAVEARHFDRWWYTAELDPLFERLRRTARFQALNDKVRRHRTEQRAQLDRMRRQGLIPNAAS